MRQRTDAAWAGGIPYSDKPIDRGGMRESGRTTAGGRILIVEDEFLVSEMIADMVAALGYSVTAQAVNLSDVRRALAFGNFDCVLLDVRLGNELTVDAADVLMERGMPFAFVTGYTEAAELRHARVPILNKPFSIDQLRLLLERLIGPAPVREAHRKQAG
jgi:CheY-like chemotaxis protein